MHKMPSHLIPDIGNVVPQNQVLPAKSILDNILRVYKQTWRCFDGTKQETWFAAEDMLGIQRRHLPCLWESHSKRKRKVVGWLHEGYN